MLTDPIAAFLTRLQNASRARRKSLTVAQSRMILNIVQLLKNKTIIEDFKLEEKDGKKVLSIMLRSHREALECRRISKPGQRRYISVDQIKKIRHGRGIGIISTSKGLKSHGEAQKERCGGEYICEIS